ncbi:MAG: HAD family phosphatase [Muribaculaceae bacterium]|nr:HAD family phosphatase [Muribaculaceae bacterium]
MDKIKNIIFDLGGVVIDLDRNMAVKALENLGLNDADSLLGEYEQKGPFLRLEKGELSSSELYDLLLPKCKPDTNCTHIRDAFEEFLRDIPEERLITLENLRKKGFRLFVLSNTNPIMFNHWIENEFRKKGKTINDYFDGIVVSFQEKMCKPEPSLFQKVVDRYDLNPEETLMLDDSEKNIRAAQSIGLQGIHISDQPGHTFNEVTESLLNQ